MQVAEKVLVGAGLSFSRPTDDFMVIHLAGNWERGQILPNPDETLKVIESASLRTLSFDASGLAAWDSNLLTFLIRIKERCNEKKVEYRDDGLPDGARRLLVLALAVPERKGARRELRKESFFVTAGEKAEQFAASAGEVFDFLGEAFVSIIRFLGGRASFRRVDLFLFLQETGSQALPIVSLISMLVGLILAFVGAIQLKTFGAQIYVADLVGIAMVRVMGAIMTGIIVAGRTGASYAAQLGTMQVNEEIDALKTLGISPMEFLVLPRMVALTLMMPLLCVYADIMGIFGGLIVGVVMLDLNPVVYLNETKAALSLTNVWIGLFHSAVFGVIIALSGCLRGIQCGRSASAVGYATTSAVVTSIVCIIVATAIITILCNVLGI
ncbi:MAG: putative phospholipid ABC transporter permease protein MlaE [Syntrophorhabdus sp. PtaU1.Bin002]|nr:MAG: putative phospholipid ABC transporter permease protein MlaE [Syntrophorhabdus sp. PtaB.Bin006]OPY71228.1 MAG: putative phospholipid ABC transporter permease protein MlaE [Syntrophorhabdus sp. PtaU1.Bin002]